MAEWKFIGAKRYECSTCGEGIVEMPCDWASGEPLYNFCPYCGANMNIKKADCETESQTCDTCRYSYITCRFMDKGEPCHYEPKTELQTEYNEYREKIRMHDPHRDW